MKKLNIRDLLIKSGKLTAPQPTNTKGRAKASNQCDGEGDMSSLTEEQRLYVQDRYLEVTAHNKHLDINDEGYITQDMLRDEFNSKFGVNKSIRSYYRIWNEDETDY